MSTVPSTEAGKRITIRGERGVFVWVDFMYPLKGEYASVRATRADFLAAVETECGVRMVASDAIVIERAEIERVAREVRSVAVEDGLTAERAHDIGVLYLLIAEQRTHPPVPPVSDEDVETLAGTVQSVLAWMDHEDGGSLLWDPSGKQRKQAQTIAGTIARRLLTGRGPDGERVTTTRDVTK